MPYFDDRALARALQDRGVELVCLAGFMRLIGPPLLEAFPDAILNVHPSLLASFPGVDAQRQALEHGVKISGATVHLVSGELDGGPIVLQSAVPVRDDDTVEMLSARILIEEHRIYPDAVRIVLERQWRLDGRRVLRPRCPRSHPSLPHAGDDPVPDALPVVHLPDQILLQERILEHDPPEDQRGQHQSDRGGEP